MPATILADLTADESTIILVADGADEQVTYAAKQLTNLTPLLKPTEPRGGMRLPASWPAVIQLATTFGAGWSPQPRLVDWITGQFALRMAERGPLRIQLPANLVPRSYQIEGAKMIAATGSALIFDEPGTGKTVTTIIGLRERFYYGNLVTPVVVVCPAAVVDSWVEHFRVWAPQWTAIPWRGTPDRRRNLVGEAHVYVTSYDTARRDAPPNDTGPLIELAPRTVVADECHKIKNQQSQQSQAVRRIAASKRAEQFIGLSGTPITHHPGNLWPTLVCLSSGAWPSRERWVRRYCESIPGDYGEHILGLNRYTEPEFRNTLLGQHRRVAKADVLAELPPKQYSVRTVHLPSAYRKAYDGMERQMLAELPDGGEIAVMEVLPQLTRLAQLACAAADVEVTTEPAEDGTEKEHVHVKLKTPSWKVDALIEVLEERPDEQVVAFAPSRQLMMIAGEVAAKAGRRVGYIVGGQTPAERTETIEQFQAGELDLICATTQAGGVGITLTAARTAVFLMRPWSLVDALQAEDRLHRIGSERHESIEIIDIVAANTIDTRVRAVLKERAGQLADLVQDPRIVAELLGGASVRKLRKVS